MSRLGYIVLGGFGILALAACADSNPTVATSATPATSSTEPSIEAVYSWVASLPTGDPLRPMFEHLPEDRAAIARLARALDSAIPIGPAEHLSANDRGRYLNIRFRDGTESIVRQVARCEPWSDADAEESVGGRCMGKWIRLSDIWWVEGAGMVKSSDLGLWWEDMTEFMAPIGSVSIPKAIRAGESFQITLMSWDNVLDAASMNLSLVSLEGLELGLGEFPVSDLFQGQATVPEQAPSGRYWLRVAGAGFSELVRTVQLE